MSRKNKHRTKQAPNPNYLSRHRGKDWLYAFLHRHGHALFSSLGRMSRAPMAAAMTIAVLAVTIALAGSFYLLIANVQQLTGNLESSNQISLFLKQRVTATRVEQLQKQFIQHPKIQNVHYISPESAMAEFKKYSGFGDALNALDKNPLPGVFQILPNNSLESQAEIEPLVTELQQLKEVDFAQMDMQWVKRLQAILQIARKAISAISLLLAMTVLFITGNTIRLELQSRKEEVLITKLVGATNAFIQRPFLYCGFWYGFFAGVAAWLIITLMLLALQQPVENLSALYDSSFKLRFLNFTETLLLIVVAALLGVLGAWNVLIQQLHTLKLG